MHDAIRAFHTLNTVAFIALGAVALVTWRRKRDSASVWAVAAFGGLAILELLALIPQHERNVGEKILTRIEIVILVVYPYLLFRFTNAFRPPGRTLARALFGLTDSWALPLAVLFVALAACLAAGWPSTADRCVDDELAASAT